MPADAARLDTNALYAQAAAETAKGSKSFYFASRFFPAEMFRHSHAVYWFCRSTDDMVDEAPSVSTGRIALDRWEEQLRFGLNGGQVEEPALQLFLEVLRECHIPAEYPLDLIAGCRMDLERQRYQSWDELRLYCYRVASCVGLMMCHVIGFVPGADPQQAKQHAIDLGLAMQITNILRDVKEDWQMGRVYFPAEDLDRFHYGLEDLAAHHVNEAFRALMQFEAERARAYYASAMPGIAMLRPQGRFAVEIAAKVYAGILREIERAHYDVYGRRAVVSATEKYWITTRSLVAAWLQR
jgi:phytoene synthase